MADWFVYMLRCVDGSLYTGITRDVNRRIHEHNHDNKLAAAYTRSRRPVKLVYQETCENRSQASAREAAIRKMSKHEKETLMKKQSRSIKVEK